MQLRYRRKRIWLSVAILIGMLLLVAQDIFVQGLFPPQYPVGLRALGYVLPLATAILIFEIWRDGNNQIKLTILCLAIQITVFAIGIFRVPLREGDTYLTVFGILILLLAPYFAVWLGIAWAVKSSQSDFVADE